ncbi:MAG: hypothetical protein GTN69_08670 [Armatimonadetes bacterium]|nr:hypothetical protein [Armatimonadota bacterium]NIO75937.1 hypothetical protein [Armatimonadota bacterium]NIO98749.1 hypothetical protein [Armatimonadota bacterium]
MFGKTLQIVSVLLLAGLLAAGCGGGTSRQDSAGSIDQAGKVALPEWAPEQPSEGLLRAVEVLKPVPLEEDDLSRADMPKEIKQVLLELKRRVDPLLWELFGTLSDEQMERFAASKEIHLRFRQLTEPQRAALEAVLDVNKGAELQVDGQPFGDFRTSLYKAGAQEDLSNLIIGFDVQEGHMVSFVVRITEHGDKGILRWTGWAQF